jgi:hypothetical protein
MAASGASGNAAGADAVGGAAAAIIQRINRSVIPSFASSASELTEMSKRVRLIAIVSIMNSSLKPAFASVTTSLLVSAFCARETA